MTDAEKHPLIDQAYQLRRSGDRRGALNLYLEATRALRAEADDTIALASAIRHTADLHEELRESHAAWQAYEMAWSLYQTVSPSPDLDLANCRRPMALWQERRGSPALAQTLWREARDWYEKAAVSTGLDLRVAVLECDRHMTALGR